MTYFDPVLIRARTRNPTGGTADTHPFRDGNSKSIFQPPVPSAQLGRKVSNLAVSHALCWASSRIRAAREGIPIRTKGRARRPGGRVWMVVDSNNILLWTGTQLTSTASPSSSLSLPLAPLPFSFFSYCTVLLIQRSSSPPSLIQMPQRSASPQPPRLAAQQRNPWAPPRRGSTAQYTAAVQDRSGGLGGTASVKEVGQS